MSKPVDATVRIVSEMGVMTGTVAAMSLEQALGDRVARETEEELMMASETLRLDAGR